MTASIDQQRLISHAVAPETLAETLKKITLRLQQNTDQSIFTAEQKLDYLKQLSEFDFGRHLLLNQGVNGYWTHYMLTHPWFGRKTQRNNRNEALSPLETFILDAAPIMLATQERFEIFLKENQKQVKNAARLASIPCGMGGELLYLDYSKIDNIKLIGIDYDINTFKDALTLAEERNLNQFTQFIQTDAWDLNFENQFDLISSNGLTIYERDPARVTALYAKFYKALNHGGKLVTSFLTPPPTMPHSEWNMANINISNMHLQKLLFVDILAAKFQCYQTTEQTQNQLESVGFRDIEFIYDSARIFPTVLAFKR